MAETEKIKGYEYTCTQCKEVWLSKLENQYVCPNCKSLEIEFCKLK
jgi:Zn finger protein HypA/HybF involved in hydrogenase expression